MKCGTTAHLELDDSHMNKLVILKNSRWRMSAFVKVVFWP